MLLSTSWIFVINNVYCYIRTTIIYFVAFLVFFYRHYCIYIVIVVDFRYIHKMYIVLFAPFCSIHHYMHTNINSLFFCYIRCTSILLIWSYSLVFVIYTKTINI